MSGSSSALVTISPESQVIVFSGNLLKAPPLNRRGRKKWHERYFLLRANKTIEIHKSRRAAEAQKTPRRVIDLRECISLELGLEYKNLQHILSLGTFKRTFFLGAPSDALMLQWGNVLEKVKGAVSGETIEVLDIGLRNTRNYNAVHRVKPSEPSRSLSSAPTSPRKNIWGRLYQRGASKSSYAISHIGKDTQNDAYGNRGSGNVGYTSYYTSPNKRSSSLSNQEAYSPSHRQEVLAYGHPKMADTSVETVDLRERAGRLSRTSSNISSSGPSPMHPPLSGAKIPPPNIMLGRWRGPSNEGSPKHGEDVELREEEDGQGWRRLNGREYGARGEAMLHRSEAFRSLGSKQETNGDMGGAWRGRRRSEDSMSRRRVRNDGSGSPLPSIPLKQSRHYRKIELQAEKPLFGMREEDEGSSDEEIDSVVSETTGRNNTGVVPVTAFPGKPYHMLGKDQTPLSVPARLELHGRRRNYSGPPISGSRSGGYGYPSGRNRDLLEFGGRGYFGGSGGNGWVGSESRHGNTSPFHDGGTELPPRPNFMNRPRPQAREVSTHKFYSLESLQRSLQEEKANSYCQVTVGARNDDSVSDITSSRTGISNAKLENILGKSSTSSLDYDLYLPSPNASSLCEEEEDKGDICLSPPLSPLIDEPTAMFHMPARGSESYLYRSSGSMRSPIDEILAPPISFEEIHATPQSSVLNETISEEGEPPTSEAGRESQRSKSSAAASDRHSTESGYTSGQGQSPGVNDRRNLSTVEEFIPAPKCETSETQPQGPNVENESNSGESTQDTLSDLSVSSIRNSQSGYSVHNSQTSYASTDSIRCYVPLVFQKRGKAQVEGYSSLFIVVCLVENSETLIKELLSQKVGGGYQAVECEGEVGRNVVNAGDDFTVETALEDLEFGFSITTSKQKDVYINRAKVREFQFQIDNLFGCSGKPFSCDVEIRHADQLTMLPIEIECPR